ncbi:hypothetical protein QWY87_05185 [Lutimonas halocynthiae]|uniref:hypothetical protein n=1 Tax=Lutimonas halocynthiae TaxID=1446477 RepID=UPI0025B44FC0|nr:hypothetical protein [Lutimonas halocynthiae]MDN3642083.1 hypothetical protein [Lutimonas halocynthiae]
MTKKSLLFIGIFLLIIGILIRKLTDFESIGLVLIIGGVACKTIYIFGKIKTGEYKPGRELYFLFIGLILFLGGIYMRKHDLDFFIPALVLIIVGLSLKIIFIIWFIKKLKDARIKDVENNNTNLSS